jgi:hypothetical protein
MRDAQGRSAMRGTGTFYFLAEVRFGFQSISELCNMESSSY